MSDRVHGLLERIRVVQEDEAPPTQERHGVRPLPGSTHVAWYLTGTRSDHRKYEIDGGPGEMVPGIAMCNVLLYAWDHLDQRWIFLGPQRPAVEGAVIEQRHYGAPVAISLRDVRGAWSVKARFFAA